MLLAMAVWGVFLWRAVNVFKPGVYSATFFNSDCAIPVLMSNDDRPVTLFNLYYYGVDRIGGWPFLLAQGVRRATGFRWSPQSVSAVQTSWLFIGALVLVALARKLWFVPAFVFLLVLCLHGETKYQIFTLAITYAWQLPALLLGWYCLRRLLEHELASVRRPIKRVAWFILTFWFCYLAIWSSIASIIFLLFLFALEAFRIWVKDKSFKLRPLGRPLVLGLIPILAATGAERLQKQSYYRHSLKHYGTDFRTRFEFDSGYIGTNLKAQVDNLIRMEWWPLHLIATLVVVAILAACAYALVTRGGEVGNKLRQKLAHDAVFLAVGLYGIALLNFVLAIVVSHVRLNLYEDRYLILTSLLSPVAAIMFVFLAVQYCAQRATGRRFVIPVFIIALLALLAYRFPVVIFREDYSLYQDTADAIAAKSQRVILLGDYWATYVVAAQEGQGRIVPVPLNPGENRMPWTSDDVQRADAVVVEYRRSRLQVAGQPPPRMSFYGKPMRLADGAWHQNRAFAFALFVSDSSGTP